MNAILTWLAYAAAVLIYWMLVIAGWIVVQWRRTDDRCAYAGEIRNTLLRLGLVFLGPPVFVLIVLLLR